MHDVVIVGAGPAGAMTALLLARFRPDLSIVLLDAAAQVRQKPCGEFLAPEGVRILADAGMEAEVMAAGAYPLHGLSLVGPHGSVRSDFLPNLENPSFRTHGLGIRRERFDGVLQIAAARRVCLRRATRIVGIERRPGGWNLGLRVADSDQRMTTRLLIGADGRQSVVRRQTGLDRPVQRQRFALVCRARGIAHGGHGEMHLVPMGQLGLAPLGDGEINLNLLLAEASRCFLRHRTPRDIMRAALRSTPRLRARSEQVQLGPILATGSLPQASHAVIDEGLALVGDAAGFCDPFTGEGICFALHAAQALAATLAQMPCTGNVTTAMLAPYARTYHRHIGWKNSFGERVQWLLKRRCLSELLVAGLGRSRLLSRALVAMTGSHG